MANRYLLGLLLLSLAMSAVVCQTFQYSHGWTNGKRAGVWSFEELMDSLGKNAAQTALFNCQIEKLRMLLQGNGSDRFLQTPCQSETPPKKTYPDSVNSNALGRLN